MRESGLKGLPFSIPSAASMPRISMSAGSAYSCWIKRFNISNALPSVGYNILAGTADASGNCMGLAAAFLPSG